MSSLPVTTHEAFQAAGPELITLKAIQDMGVGEGKEKVLRVFSDTRTHTLPDLFSTVV